MNPRDGFPSSLQTVMQCKGIAAQRRRGMLLLLLMLTAACSHEPTSLDVPPGAANVEQLFILDGRAHQTQFTMDVKFPQSPAVDFYQKSLNAPWIKCEWASAWSSHVDAQGTEPFTVHQQLHYWVNPEIERTLMLTLRYHSTDDSCEIPDNDTQHIVVVEYLRTSVADTISHLKLRCPPTSEL